MIKKFLFLFLLTFTLYKLKYEVINLEDLGKEVEQKINSLKYDYAVLSAEWKFLTSPTRIQFLSEKYLKLQDTDPYQLTKLDDYLNKKQSVFIVSKKISKNDA